MCLYNADLKLGGQLTGGDETPMTASSPRYFY